MITRLSHRARISIFFLLFIAPVLGYLPSASLLRWRGSRGVSTSPHALLPSPRAPATTGLSSATWHRPMPSSTRRMSGRDVMEVKGLPKANIMRTNSTAAAYALDFDMTSSIRTRFEDDMQRELMLLEPEAEAATSGNNLALGAGASVISAAALIAGCMVGAGVLALPSVTVHSGFAPSTAAIAAVWSYCMASGLLIGEVCINSRGKAAAASYLKIAGATVGRDMATVAFSLFTVFQYLLLVAYIAQGGALLNNFLGLMHSVGLHLHFDGPLAPAAFTLGMGSLLTLGNKRILENINNVVVTVVLGTFSALLFSGLQNMDPALLEHHDVAKLHDVVPVAMCALVFQNVIPLISSSLHFDRTKIRSAILLGSGFPMLMYLAWNAMVIGNIHPSAVHEGVACDLPSLLHGAPQFGALFAVFSLAAIVTSFIGSTLSIIEEISEFLRGPNPGHVDLKEPSALEKLPLYAVVLVPPLLAAVVYPEGFLSAIETSGGYGDPFLFGLLPVIMAWKQRYGGGAEAPPAAMATTATSSSEEDGGSITTIINSSSSSSSSSEMTPPLPSTSSSQPKAEPLLPGGKFSLVMVALTTVAMFINKSSESMPFLRDLMASHHDTVLAAADGLAQQG